MAVRSTDMKDNEPAADLHAPKGRRKASAVVSRAQLARTRGWFERISAGVVLMASYLGTVFTFAGGVVPLLNAPSQLFPWLGALAAQGLLTALQWWYGNVSRAHPVYLAALVSDTGLTTWGFAPLLVPPLAALLAANGIDGAVTGAWALLAVVSLVAAYYPESRFVD